VAISNRRLLAFDERGVTFRVSGAAAPPCTVEAQR
jgi:hypothetical protein